MSLSKICPWPLLTYPLLVQFEKDQPACHVVFWIQWISPIKARPRWISLSFLVQTSVNKGDIFTDINNIPYFYIAIILLYLKNLFISGTIKLCIFCIMYELLERQVPRKPNEKVAAEEIRSSLDSRPCFFYWFYCFILALLGARIESTYYLISLFIYDFHVHESF